ncbi:sulfite exporter TauE/SafE family protein [Daejeonella oryzae]|uniref:sulfite exporter TauE/SafE family protein n=1 Tax=Daejeonella oryzae TaxID=1122943 RepID=UPI00041AA09D|nr:sulfite exporter TauE/SafE family protein [Daejeonella oryzae]
MSNEALAFFTGLFGSLHCVVMCGPLVMALPFSGRSFWFSTAQKILYQFGRILTYSFLGFIAGYIGSGFNILGLQQFLSLITGIILVLIAVYHFSGKKDNMFTRIQTRMVAPIASKMGYWLSKSYGGLFAGALHGLIPCGMVYMAIAGSLNSETPFDGSRFMFFFGLGTTPLLIIASVLPFFLKKFRAPRLLIPALFMIAGFFLITRGLNLNIPLITSPVISDPSAPIC